MRPDAPEVPGGLRAAEVLRLVARHPWRYVVRRWNYKAAVTSSLVRGALFFAANLAAGLPAATAALLTEFVFRFATSGCYGALTQAFRRVEPARSAMVTAMIVLPACGHGLELVVHWLRGTVNLGASVAASVALTVVSTAFNLYVMRRGALITGAEAGSLAADLRRLPSLFLEFVADLLRHAVRV
ncbi:MAG: hypothetical protein AB7H88_09935 [Vicinamibacterales bacterium]